MIAMICLFFPAVLAMWIFEYVEKVDLSCKQWGYRYCANVMLINFICFMVKKLVLNSGAEVMWNLQTDMLPSVAANYLIMAVPVAAAAAVIQVLLYRHVEIEVEENKA